METILKLRLLDSSDDECVCFGDIIEVPYSSSEELFKAVFGIDSIGAPLSDIWVGLDENLNPVMLIDFRIDLRYSFHYYNGIEMYNEILYFFEKTKRVLTSTKLSQYEHEITDEEVYAILSGEMINDGTNAPDHDDYEEYNEPYDEIESESYLRFMYYQNEEAKDKIDKVGKGIIELTDEPTYKYIIDLIKFDKNRIINKAKWRKNNYL